MLITLGTTVALSEDGRSRDPSELACRTISCHSTAVCVLLGVLLKSIWRLDFSTTQMLCFKFGQDIAKCSIGTVPAGAMRKSALAL